MTKHIFSKLHHPCIVAFCAIQLCLISEIHAQNELEDFDLEAHRRHYNSLPAVEESDATLQKSSQFNHFLKEAEEIVTRFEFESFMGLRLIHRHFDLGKNQLMTEEYKVVDHLPSLVTSARYVESAKEINTVPSSWIFSSQSNEPVQLFETSTDSAVKTASALLHNSPEFTEEMGNLLREHSLTDLLSVAVLKRESLVASPDQVYMEVNYGDTNSSVVQLWNASDSPGGSIRTSWSFKGPRQHTCHYEYYCANIDGQHWNIAAGHHN